MFPPLTSGKNKLNDLCRFESQLLMLSTQKNNFFFKKKTDDD